MTAERNASLGHVIWLGGVLPDLAWLTVQLALERGRLQHIQLWSQRGQLTLDGRVRALVATGRVTLRDLDDLDDPQLDATVGQGTRAALCALDGQLRVPAIRADLARLRVVWQEGGIYLDADALCLQDVSSLCDLDGFCGLEHIALPAALYRSRNPLRWARAGALVGLRHALSLRPGAGARFAQVQGFFDLACNNAVLGAKPRHPLVGSMLRSVARMPVDQASTLYELGPRLLESATGNQSIAATATSPGWEVLPPHVCFPLAPEVCADYVADDPLGSLGTTPHPQALIAHLYDSVLARRVGQRIDLAWLEAHRDTTLLGRMVRPWLGPLRKAIAA